MHDDERVAEILEQWYADREAGSEASDPEALIREHPEHAEALRAHFEVVHLVDRAFDAPAATPDRIGPYRIVAELGSGGMGKVYLADDAAGARFALKLVHPHLLESPSSSRRRRSTGRR